MLAPSYVGAQLAEFDNMAPLKVHLFPSLSPSMANEATAQENAEAYAMMQAQIHEQQHLLYMELQHLACQEGVMRQSTQPASMHPALPPAAQLQPMATPFVPGVLWAPSCASAAPVAAGKSAGAAAPGSAPSNRRRAPPQTLSTSLRLLEDKDPDCLIIVRKISKLGFKATQSLKKHFSTYGPVVKVLLAHSTARQYCDQQFHVKRRPSNLGFIQMGSTEAVKQVLAASLSPEIEGVTISVSCFERQGDADDVEEDELAEILIQSTQVKHERGISDVSTCASTSAASSPTMTYASPTSK